METHERNYIKAMRRNKLETSLRPSSWRNTLDTRMEEYIGDQSTSNRRVGDTNQLGNYIGYQHIGYTRGGILVDNDMSRARVGLAGKMFGLTTGRTARPCLAQARLCCRMALRHDCITKPDGLRSAVSFFMTSLNTRPSFAAMSTFASTPRALRA